MRQGNSAMWALAVAALVILVSGGVVLGSNMGFKFNMPLPAQISPAPQGFNIMSIPYLVPYADRQCLCEQLGLSGAGVIQEFNAAAGALDFYLCGSGTCGSATGLASGTATFITDTGSPGNAIVVGAHDPSKSITLHCNTGPLPQGDNWTSVPYHSTSATTQDICDEVGPVATVGEFDGSLGTLATYFCDINPAASFNLTKGRAVKIVLDSSSPECTGGSSINWVPNHF